jgi:hypothetical protein
MDATLAEVGKRGISMYIFDYHHVKSLDEQRRRRSLARFEVSRHAQPAEWAVPVAEVIEVDFPEECTHTERLGA